METGIGAIVGIIREIILRPRAVDKNGRPGVRWHLGPS